MNPRQIILVVSIIVSTFFLAVYLVAFFSWKRRRKRIPDEKLPTVSIVVPAYNEGENIGETIESLLRLNYPKDKMEIIVVDDGSTDNTYDVAKRYEGETVRVIRKENGGKSSALNMGIKHARGEIIACMDADSVATPDSLRVLVEYILEEDADAVTPVMHVWKPKT
ncbi:MAG: poly-beta,6-N-acetyl-D-glucosamine synthase, partial [Candidatus Diapherotrites archaeon]|nr:poly-beta,6-N-acetyl-D-glucosamine synthase [Candidatus Diapherotrites archaeon]